VPYRSRASARRYVLDANALIGFFEGRPGVSAKVSQLLEEAARLDVPVLMSAVTWGEVFYIEWRYRGELNAWRAESRLHELPIVVFPADQRRATRAGVLKQKHALGYADSFAAELAIEQGAWLVTADPEFAKVGKGLAVYTLPRHER
jgi:predicted nucleic acid-binding protein